MYDVYNDIFWKIHYTQKTKFSRVYYSFIRVAHICSRKFSELLLSFIYFKGIR